MKIEIETREYEGLGACEDCPLAHKCGAESICELIGVPEDEHIIGIKTVEQ